MSAPNPALICFILPYIWRYLHASDQKRTSISLHALLANGRNTINLKAILFNDMHTSTYLHVFRHLRAEAFHQRSDTNIASSQ